MGNHSVRGHPSLLKEWDVNGLVDGISLDEIQVWFQLLNFSTRLWEYDIFAKVASMIGSPIAIDKLTKEGERLEFARLCF